MNKALVVILFAVMLDAIGIGLIFPILPSLLREVGHTTEIATTLGIMLALRRVSHCDDRLCPLWSFEPSTRIRP